MEEIKEKQKRKRKKILVCVNTLTSIDFAAYRDHNMFFYRLGRDFPHMDFGQFYAKRMSIDRFRNSAASVACQGGFDYLMFIDDDMLFENPREVFGPLYKANLDIISAFTYIRGYPYEIMSFKEIKVNGQKHLDYVKHRDLTPDNPKMRPDGVIMCDAIGTAVSLIKVSLLKNLTPPWFITGQKSTEDIYFCCLARDTFPKVKIGMHTRVIAGHILEAEAISVHTRKHLRDYQESYMTADEIKFSNRDKFSEENQDRGQDYIRQEVEPTLDEIEEPIEVNT